MERDKAIDIQYQPQLALGEPDRDVAAVPKRNRSLPVETPTDEVLAPILAAARGSLGANLRRLREKLGLSQEQLAERAGLSQIYVAGIEQARPTVNPTLRALVALGNALGSDVATLMGSTAPTVPRRAGRPRKAREVVTKRR